MKKNPRCTQCKSKTVLRSLGNYDRSTYKEGRNGHVVKDKKPSEYRVVFQCKKGTCEQYRVFGGRSSSVVHRQINSLVQQQRQELLDG